MSNIKIPNSTKIYKGVYLSNEYIKRDEQLEIFDFLKPIIETQAYKTNKSPVAPHMIGLGMRWDYVRNNPKQVQVNIPNPIVQQQHRYGYYNKSINGVDLFDISNKIKFLATKYTGVDTTEYDGCIVNIYDELSFIPNHNDVDESIDAINYPVIGLNIGGTGNFYINNKHIDLKDGSCYLFGVNGKSRKSYHRTFPTKQSGFLPKLVCKLDNKIYHENNYRITITLRKVLTPIKPIPAIFNNF